MPGRYRRQCYPTDHLLTGAVLCSMEPNGTYSSSRWLERACEDLEPNVEAYSGNQFQQFGMFKANLHQRLAPLQLAFDGEGSVVGDEVAPQVPIGVIASFRKMKKLVQDHAIIEAALRTSSNLVVSPDGKRIRRLDPLPRTELKDAKKCTVVVENLPPDFSTESLQEKFGAIGKIVNITIHDPSSVKESATPKKIDFILGSKVHALIEYNAVEEAEKAVTTLNDKRSWRTGLKVNLMAKRSVIGSGKCNQFSKENQDSASTRSDQNKPTKKEQNTTSEKNSSADSAEGSTNKENMNSVLTHEDELQHQMPNAKGGRKGRYKGQGQVQQNAKGQGCSGPEPSNKPVPGPRMPDGTRGFTMGRGRPLSLQKSEKVEE